LNDGFEKPGFDNGGRDAETLRESKMTSAFSKLTADKSWAILGEGKIKNGERKITDERICLSGVVMNITRN
jgi:hypothetical protein